MGGAIMKNGLVLFLSLSLLLCQAACDRKPTPLEPGVTDPGFVSLQTQQTDSPSKLDGPGVVIGEIPHTVLDVQIEVTGSFRPGEPLQATGSVTPNISAKDLHLKIWSPDLEFAKISGFGESFRVQKGLKIPSLTGVQLSGEVSQQGHRVSTEITIPPLGSTNSSSQRLPNPS